MKALVRSLRLVPVVVAAALASCATGPGDTSLPLTCALAGGTAGAPSNPVASGIGLALDSALDYSGSAVDAWRTSGSGLDFPSIALATNDAVVRKLADGAVVLNRGSSGSLLFIDGRLGPAGQISLGDCGPHDVQLLDDCRVLVTCFEKSKMAVVSLDTGAVTDGPDLAAFADADGIPEMDQITRVGDRLYVSLDLLDRNDPWWAPATHGLVVALDARTLEVQDLDPMTAGTQALEVCTQPYTDFSLGADGRLYLGCSGVYGVADTSSVVAFDPALLTVEVVADGPTLQGQLSELHLDAAGVPYVVTAYPYTKAWELPQEMRLARLGQSGLEVLYSVATSSSTDPGFVGALGGFAVATDGRLFVANRSSDSSAGLWTVEPDTGASSGPLATTLPPLDIVTF